MGQVIMPEILSDHDLDWSGSGTPASSRVVRPTTSEQTILQAGTYAVATGGISVEAVTAPELVSSNLVSGERIRIYNGETNPLFDVTGTGAGAGYKLKIINDVPITNSNMNTRIVMSGGAVYDHCTMINIPISDITDITPSMVVAVPSSMHGSDTDWIDNEGGGFYYSENDSGNGGGGINDVTAFSGTWNLNDNSSTCSCDNSQGIKIPVNSGHSRYTDSESDYRVPGPDKYTVFILGTPRGSN